MKKPSTIAWDARLVGGNSTGDSTYWTGLLHGLRHALDAAQTDIRFLLFSTQPCPAGVELPEFCRWVVLPSKGAMGSRLWSYAQFPLAARRMGADLIHVQYSMSPLVRDRGVTTIHDVSFFVGPQWFGAKDRFLLQRSVPSAARRARRIIAVSETSGKEIEHYIPAAKGKVRVTTLAAAPWIQRLDAEEARAMVAQEFGETGPYYLTVGTRWARKNQELAVAAVEGLPDSMPHRLLVAGKNVAPFSGNRCRSLGYVSESMLSALYSGAEAVLFPSLHEGFGIPALEAMTTGTAVVVGHGGALPEVVGDAGVVVSSFDAADWTGALVRLAAESSNLLEMRGLARAKEFSWQKTAEKTLAVYEEVLRA